MMTRSNRPLNHRIALFDSDCLEAASADSCRSKVLPGFGVRARMQPLMARLDMLYAFARKHDLTMVFTHCCSAAPVRPGTHRDVLIVPLDPSDHAWVNQVKRYRLINIEKRHEAPLQESFICRHFDAFQHNANARQLFRILDIPEWIVFGHGFDLCVDSSVKGIVSSGYKVRLLTDVIASSATGYGPYGTEESKRSILGYLKKIGVATSTLREFLRSHDAVEQRAPVLAHAGAF
jgi:hypothetical protein